ncbi:hemerythrin family protein [Sulfurimonas sp.]|uniref:hemerythrin family protein n=1 Tax=Sulfurimonas sp. TaxID=2022749 RepID=UPI00356B40B0
MKLINLDTLPQVAMEFMNDVHEEDVNIINDLYEFITEYESNPTQEHEKNITNKYQEWFDHTVAHFKREEEKMIELHFPPYPVHKGEHDNALHTMDTIFRDWNSSKDIAALKEYLENQLPEWLVHHIQTMDTVTAMFFKTGLSPCSAH